MIKLALYFVEIHYFFNVSLFMQCLVIKPQLEHFSSSCLGGFPQLCSSVLHTIFQSLVFLFEN